MSDLFGIALVDDLHASGLKLHPESLNNKVRTLFCVAVVIIRMLLLYIYLRIS